MFPSSETRKKVYRACARCQKSHLNCSDERPCQRCVQANVAETCQDGPRRLAKYLREPTDVALDSIHFSTVSATQETTRASLCLYSTPQEIYANVKTPYDYTVGFHNLINFAKEK